MIQTVNEIKYGLTDGTYVISEYSFAMNMLALNILCSKLSLFVWIRNATSINVDIRQFL